MRKIGALLLLLIVFGCSQAIKPTLQQGTYFPAGIHYMQGKYEIYSSGTFYGDGPGRTVLVFPDSGFFIQSGAWLYPSQVVTIKDMTIRRATQAPVNDFSSKGVEIRNTTGYNIENVWIEGFGIAYYIGKYTHDGWFKNNWLTRNRIGVFLEETGLDYSTDNWITDNFICGEFGTYGQMNHGYPDNYKITDYPFGIYQSANTVGDTYIQGNTILRYRDGIHIRSLGNEYNYNLEVRFNILDQFNGQGMYFENIKNSDISHNQSIGIGQRDTNVTFKNSNNVIFDDNIIRGTGNALQTIKSKLTGKNILK